MPAGRRLEGEPLVCAVAGILFMRHVLRPGCAVDVGHEGEVEVRRPQATAAEVDSVVKQLHRRGLDVAGRQRQPGYALREWLEPAIMWVSRAPRS